MSAVLLSGAFVIVVPELLTVIFWASFAGSVCWSVPANAAVGSVRAATSPPTTAARRPGRRGIQDLPGGGSEWVGGRRPGQVRRPTPPIFPILAAATERTRYDSRLVVHRPQFRVRTGIRGEIERWQT